MTVQEKWTLHIEASHRQRTQFCRKPKSFYFSFPVLYIYYDVVQICAFTKKKIILYGFLFGWKLSTLN